MGPELIALGIIGAALVFYAVLGGADFGAGIWEFNSALESTPEERALIQRAVGPVWEANHVWLIFALIVSHTTFPIAFRAVSQALWLPLFLALIGIVFRGVGFVFRAYGDQRQQTLWGAVFSIASTAAPFFFGACVGAIASGNLSFDPDGRFTGDFITGWIGPLPIFAAFFAVGTCCYLAAVFFTRDAARSGAAALTARWRRRAMANGAWMGIFAAAGLVLLRFEAPHLWQGLLGAWWLLVGSAVAGTSSIVALASRRLDTAMLLAGGAVITVMIGWMLAQHPYLVPPTITVDVAKGPSNVTAAAVGVALAGAALLLPSLCYLFWLFKWRDDAAQPAPTDDA